MTTGDACTIAFPPRLQIADLAELQRQLTEAADRPQPIVLEASRVERADAAALQLLTSFVQTLAAGGRSIEWRSPSTPLREAARLLALEPHLLLPGSDSVSPPPFRDSQA